MPAHSEGHKSKGSKREKAAKSRGQKTRHGKKMRATHSSRAAVTEYSRKIRNGENVGAMFVAEVLTAPGGGHFRVEDISSKEKILAHVTRALSMKSAGKRDSEAEFSIQVGSHVLVDGNIIRAVVPREKLSAIKEENSNSNSLFTRGSHSGSRRKNRTRKNRH